MTSETVASDDLSGVRALLAGYRPTPGSFDEMLDETGQVRPHWRDFVASLGALASPDVAVRFAAADRYLKDSGVFYRIYDEPAGERPWPLSHVPLLISGEDWKAIEAGALQRARLLDAVLADCYGSGRLVQDGLLPAAVIAGSPDYLRPLVGATGEAQRPLFLYAVDLGRNPAGTWWAIRDRTQAPSGMGYALENRIALWRSVSDAFRTVHVEQIGPFFDRLRSELARLREPEDAGAAMLTPGPLNETYFEHVYLARQLGLRLVEGADLTAHEDAVYLRTVSGLRRVKAILRRIDSEFADPLELDTRSQLGVAGLVQAVRKGTVTIANALGSGLAEARALRAFLPGLSEALLGETLLTPNVATWWCGEAEARDFVCNNLDRLALAPAFVRIWAGRFANGPLAMAEVDEVGREELLRRLEARGIDFVGQETVKLSTTPVWVSGRLEPRPFILRVFVVATADGYHVMPGGFALIGDKSDTRAISMQRGGRSADVWVLGDGSAGEAQAPAPPNEVVIRRASAALPSRAADNLFWLARYVERAEETLRVVRALSVRTADRRDSDGADAVGLADLLHRWRAAGDAPIRGKLEESAATAMLHNRYSGAVPVLVAAARAAAFVIRDRFPPDGWRALEDLNAYVVTARAGRSGIAVHERAAVALRIIAAVAGYQFDTMNRLSGWRFLKLGLRLERALAISRFARRLGRPGATPEELGALLELADVRITYRMRYPFGAALAPVLDLVLLDESNPRSLAFQVQRFHEHVSALPRPAGGDRTTPALATAERLIAAVGSLDPAAVKPDALLGIENMLMRASEEISETYFRARAPMVADGP